VPVEIAWAKMAVRWKEAEMMSGTMTAAIRARNRNDTFSHVARLCTHVTWVRPMWAAKSDAGTANEQHVG